MHTLSVSHRDSLFYTKKSAFSKKKGKKGGKQTNLKKYATV